MRRLRDGTSAKFYDPLYDVVVFSATDARDNKLSFWLPDTHQTVTAEHFLKIIDTYEFDRLTFLKQAGLAWLVFPSATHTRFSHSLGCWLLSDWAAGSVFVFGQQQSGGPHSTRSPVMSPVRLGERLRDADWLEEFQLALLLHDIGHFPFSHVIENNDTLIERYLNQKETEGIRLRHESIGSDLMRGNNAVSDLFRQFITGKLGTKCLSRSQFLSDLLKELPNVDTQNLAFLLDDQLSVEELDVPSHQRPFLTAVRELVSGVVDLDRLDHYHRDSHFISLHVGEFNVRGLLHHLAIVGSKKSEGGDEPIMNIQLVGDGVGHAFQMLYAKMTLTQTVFHNPNNLAYEVMLNTAINRHWPTADSYFRGFLPFLDDGELLHHLLCSDDSEVRELVNMIKHRCPLACAGRFILPPNAVNELGTTGEERRSALREALQREWCSRGLNVNREECFLRVDSGFGRDDTESEWMDLGRVLGDNGEPLSTMEDHSKFVEFVRQHENLSSREFWIFIADELLADKAAAAAVALGALDASRG